MSWVIYHIAYHEAFKASCRTTSRWWSSTKGRASITNIVNPDAGMAAERPVKLKIEDEHGVALARFALV